MEINVLTIQEYQKEVTRTVNNSLDKDERLKNYCFGLGGETGELLDLFKKYFYHGHVYDKNSIKKELGDICWYLVNIANECNFDFEEILKLNIDKLKKRYPDGFSHQDSINRSDK